MFSDNFYPELSGIADSILITGKQLAARGHKIDFYVPNYSVKDFTKSNLVKKEIDLGPNITVHRFFSFPFPTSSNQGRLIVPTLWRWHKMKKHRPDIIHTHLFFGAGFEALIAAKFLRVPLVGTNHTAIMEFVKQSPVDTKFLERLSLKLVSWFYNKCDFVSAPSQGIINEMKLNGFVKANKVISNPVNTKKYYIPTPEEKSSLKQEFNFSNQTIICVGRLAPEKKVDVIVRAMALVSKEMPATNLVIAGHGSEEKKLQDLVKELGLEGKVKFLGFLKKEVLEKVYRAIDIYAIASTSETQNIDLIKALASGVPAVGVNARALPEYINHDNGFIVEPGDYQMMAEKFIFLLKNPEVSAKMGRAGNLGVQQFSEEKIASEWEKFYQQIINIKK